MNRTLAAWPGVFFDPAGSVIGFWGLALPEMAHGYAADGHQLSTWCAWDALFLTPILDRVAQVSSSCPVTGLAVSVTVGPEGVRRVEPAGAVTSFLAPQITWTEDVITMFCHYVLFFASRAAGEQWVDRHPGTFLLELTDAFELGPRVNALRFGAALNAARAAG